MNPTALRRLLAARIQPSPALHGGPACSSPHLHCVITERVGGDERAVAAIRMDLAAWRWRRILRTPQTVPIRRADDSSRLRRDDGPGASGLSGCSVGRGACARRRIVMEDVIMDSERFDTLTRTLASGMSRRGVLRTLGGVSAGGVLAVVGRGTAEAGKPAKCPRSCLVGKGKNATCCGPNQECSGGACVPMSANATLEFWINHNPSYSCECFFSGNPTAGGGSCGLLLTAPV